MKGYILFWVAMVVFLVLLPFCIAYNAIRSLFHGGNRLHYVAILIDKIGNVMMGPFFNDTMQRDGYEFGHYTETISKVLGINKELGTLTKFGKVLADFLNWIDKDHVEKAARKIEL